MMSTMDFLNAQWIHRPNVCEVTAQSVAITTEPGTDFWQRSYYGFRNDNAPALLSESDANISFTTRASFEYGARFDQCGIIVYLDSENWCKVGIEYDTEWRLGSVVTNRGYSDWATTDIEPVPAMWYRLSRRGPDFLIESSLDGVDYAQMRIFHLHALGETTPDMGELDPPAPPERPIRFGVYACSPTDGSFEARFDRALVVESMWRAHRG